MNSLNKSNITLLQEYNSEQCVNSIRENIELLNIDTMTSLVKENIKVNLTNLKKRPESYSFDECNSSELVAELIHNSAIFCFETNCWWVFDGILWIKDQKKIIVERVITICLNVLLEYTYCIKDFDLQERYHKQIKRLMRYNSRKNILADCRSASLVHFWMFDSNANQVNFMNGVYDLKEDKFISGHKPSDYMTKICACNYDPTARSTRFEKFIQEICSDWQKRIIDQEEIEYKTAVAQKMKFLQLVLGYCLFGKNPEEKMFILHGPSTRNGKGTLMNTVMKILHTYGRTTSAEILASKKYINSSAPSEEIARLAGARLINITEADKNTQMRSGTIKSLVGNDPIAARFLHENSFEFRPDFKMILSTNHLLTCNDPTIFKSNRIVLIPFNNHFDERTQDTRLKDDFAKPEVLSAVANWLIQGYRYYKIEKFNNIPDEVKEATNSYQKESDQLECYIAECLQGDPHSEVPLKALHSHYQDWCTDNGYSLETLKQFKNSLLQHAKIIKKRPNGAPASTTQLQMVCGFAFSKKMVA